MMHDSTNNVKTMYSNTTDVVCVKNNFTDGFSPPVVNASIAYFRDFKSNLTTTSNITFNLSNCTLEYFVYQTRTANTTCNIGKIALNINDTQQFVFRNDTSPSIKSYDGIAINQWHHMAVSTNGSKIRMYVDGVQLLNPLPSISTFGITSTTASYPLFLSGNDTYYSEMRISNTCLYTTDTIIPTLPFSSGPSTSFLLKHNISSSYFSSQLDLYDPYLANGFWKGWYYMNVTSNVTLTSLDNSPCKIIIGQIVDNVTDQIYVSPNQQRIFLGSNLYYPIQIFNTGRGPYKSNIDGRNILNQYIQNIDFPIQFKITRNGSTLKSNSTPNFIEGYDVILEVDRTQNKFTLREPTTLNYLASNSSGVLSLVPLDITSTDFQWTAISTGVATYELSNYGIRLGGGPVQFIEMDTSNIAQNYIWYSLSTRSNNATFTISSTTYPSTQPINVYFSTSGSNYTELTTVTQPYYITPNPTIGNLPTISNLSNHVTYYTSLRILNDFTYTYSPVSFLTKYFGSAVATSPTANSTAINFTVSYTGYPTSQIVQVFLADNTRISTATTPTLSTDVGTLASPPYIYNLLPANAYSFYVYTPGDTQYDSYGSSANAVSLTTKYAGTAYIQSVIQRPLTQIMDLTISYTGYPSTQPIQIYLNNTLINTGTVPTLSLDNPTLSSSINVSGLSSSTPYSVYLYVPGDATYDSYGANTAISFALTGISGGTAALTSITTVGTTATLTGTYNDIYPPSQPIQIFYSNSGSSYRQLTTSTIPTLSKNSGNVSSLPTITNIDSNVLLYTYLYVPSNDGYNQYGTSANALTYSYPHGLGGTVSTVTDGGVNYFIHTYKTTGANTFRLTNQSKIVDIFMIGGGGGGGPIASGTGGGAGGLIMRPSYTFNNGTYTLTIGNGGATGVNGANTVMTFNNSNIFNAVGGGRGGGGVPGLNGGSGGSGGGGSSGGGNGVGVTGGTGLQPSQSSNSGTPYGYGNAGGAPVTSGAASGGGAGASGRGLSNVSLSGATFTFSNMYGTSIGGQLVGSDRYFAGGGGNGTTPGIAASSGGYGGGGAGKATLAIGDDGTPNTGGGGGGGYTDYNTNNYNGGSGGSGIVCIRYLADDTPLYAFTRFTFTSAGIIGQTGPTLTQLKSDSLYASNTWTQSASNLNMTTQGIQLWTVPTTAFYTLIAAGATGRGGDGFTGGFGAIVTNTVYLQIGQTVKILVGQMGTSTGGGTGGDGGGATFVTNNNNSPYLVAGGGGGSGIGAVSCNGGNANDTVANGPGNGLGLSYANNGGSTGFPGGSFLTDGTQSLAAYGVNGQPIPSFVQSNGAANRGGFGCGGGRGGGFNNSGGGGGGGYTGAGPGGQQTGGGGGSSYDVTGSSNYATLYSTPNNTGTGYVTIIKN
jgi:hypothetical protein